MTPHDETLIDAAMSTSYKDTILELIDEADTQECMDILIDILVDPEMSWEK